MRDVMFILVACCFLASSTAAEPANGIRRVLILNEEGLSFPGINLMDREIRAALERSPYQIELYDEFLEVILFPDETYQQQLRESFLRKYRDRKPDLIIAEGAASIKFMIESHQEFFPNTPIVICGGDQAQADNSKLDSQFTGTWMTLEPAKTLDAALQLQPSTKHVIVIGGAGPWDKPVEAIVRESLRNYDARFEFTYLTDLAVPTLLERLKRLPSHTIIFYTTLSQDAAGTHFVDATQLLPLVADVANAPVFVLADTQVGRGPVGGYITSYSAQGQVAGEIALRILRGEQPRDIPIVTGTNVYLFDWRALKRWGFAESNLPPGSTVLYRQFSVWESYRRYIIGAIFVVLAQSLLILGLLWQRARRRKVEDKLVVTNERLHLAMESGKVVGWEWDVKTGRDSWFGDLKMMFGIPSDTYVWRTENFYEHVHPDDRKHVSQALADARKTHKPYVGEFHVVRPDGAQRWVFATGKFHYSRKGEPERMLGMALDITERKRAEQDLRESEERFRLVANQAPVLIWMSGPDKLCIFFNQSWLNFTGRSMELELGEGWTSGVHPEDLRRCLKAYSDAFDARVEFEIEYRLRRFDGKYRWIVDYGVPRIESDGTFLGYIGSCLDVTDRKTTEESLEELSGRLINAHEEERTRIARELHDDFSQRLALQGIGLGQLWKNLPKSDVEGRAKIEELLKRIREISSDMHSLSHQLHSSKLEHVGLVSALTGLCEEMRSRYKIQIEFSERGVSSEIPKDVALCLFRITQEALGNVVKHSQAKQAQAELFGTNDAIRLRIVDAGVGFDPDLRRTGIGLISMRERLRLVGGTLSIMSAPMRGTEILVQVPLSMYANRAHARTQATGE